MFKLILKKNPDLLQHKLEDLKVGDIVYRPANFKYYRIIDAEVKTSSITNMKYVMVQMVTNTYSMWIVNEFLFEDEEFKLVKARPNIV
jgi:hypothetical protein